MTHISVFAGLGSEALFSDVIARQGRRDSSTPTGTILLQACHRCFRAEISRANTSDPSLGIDLDDFRNEDSLFEPCRRYHRNAVVQHATLCVVQLLHYLKENERAMSRGDAPGAAVVAGFCAGLLPAVAAATSTTLPEFLSRCEDCFRLALLLGIASDTSRRALKVINSKPWSMVVEGMGVDEMRELLSNHVPAKPPLVPVYISSINSPCCVTLSADGPTLQAFLRDHISSECRIRPTNLYSLYHNEEVMSDARECIIGDFMKRQLSFPQLSDMVTPIVSTVDGSIITRDEAGDRTALLELILDMSLCRTVDWVAVQDCILSIAQDAMTTSPHVQVRNFGPGYGALKNRKDLADGISVVDMSSDHSSDEHTSLEYSPDDIAIVGVGIDLPGAEDNETLWQNLMNGLNSCKEIPSDRFHVEDYYTGDSSRKPVNPKRAMATKFGNFLNNPFLFDSAFFDISPREARSIDPQQRVMLQTAYRALEDAGYVPDSTATTMRDSFGCFIGNATLDYADNLRNDIDVYYSPGTLRAFLAGRISYAFGWSGPSCTIDTACSSSLVAIHQASRALLAGDCKAAVAGGVNIITSPDMYLGLDRAHFLSPTGQCRAFDQAADGYCRSEGCAAFVLKKLSDAVAENDRILGVIKGTDVNQSGETHSITHPHSPTQEKLFRKLLAKTSIHPHDISVVEAHGTGTQAGDPNEVGSLRAVLCEGRDSRNSLHITSIKANIGHCEAASGGAALAKLLLMLQHGKIPPQPSLVTLNPRIEELGTDGALINQQAATWNPLVQGKPRLAMLNNFGAAGSNAALILEEYLTPKQPELTSEKDITYFFGCSAKDEATLDSLRNSMASFLDSNECQHSLADICYSSTARRQIYNYRISASASSREDLASKLRKVTISEVSEQIVPIVFLFGGQGSQYLGMGRTLMETFPDFRKTVVRSDRLLRDWDLPSCLEIICASDGKKDSNDASQLQAFQTGVFVLEVALAQLLMSFGIFPDMVSGHSLGEYAALVIAGVLDFESGLRLVAGRARMIIEKCELKSTSMLAVGSPADQIRKAIETDTSFDGLVICCENSQDSCVVGGKLTQLSKLKDHLSSSSKAKSTLLDVPVAYHTAALDPILKDLEDLASQLPLSAAEIPVASNVLGRVVDITEDVFNPEYFATHCRQAVAFDQGIQAIIEQDEMFAGGHWIEIGPHPALISMISKGLGSASTRLSALRKDKHASETLSELFSALFTAGVECDWRVIFERLEDKPSLVPIPVMPFNLKEFSIALRREEPLRLSDDVDSSALTATPYKFLSKIISLPDDDGASDGIFETPIQELASYIEGHIVCESALCPASVYQEMALSGVKFLDGGRSQDTFYKICDVSFARPLIFQAGLSLTVRIVVGSEDAAKRTRKFTITSYDPKNGQENAQTHCHGITKKYGASKLVEKFARKERVYGRRKAAFAADQTFSSKTMYEKIFTRVVKYSPKYRAVQQIKLDERSEEILAVCKLPASPGDDTFAADPVLVDTLLHVAGFAANLNVSDDDVCICSSVSSAIVLRNDVVPGSPFDVHCSNFYSAETGTVLADAYAVDSDGIIAAVKGMEFQRANLSKMATAFNFATRQTSKPASPAPKPDKPTLKRHASDSSSNSDTGQTSSPVIEEVSSGQRSVAELVAETCGVDPSQVTPQTKLNGLGIDSLMIFELEEKLQEALDLRLRSGELAKCETVRDVEILATPATSQSSSPAPRATSHESATEQRRARRRRKSRLSSVQSDRDAQRETEAYEDDVGSDEPEVAISSKVYGMLSRSLRLDENPKVVRQAGEYPDSTSPVFLFHPGSGFCPPSFYTLTSLARPLYAVSDPKTLAPSEDRWPSVNTVAAEQVKLVLRTSKSLADTPLILAGYSFGGVVAFEVARLLHKSGDRTVAGVVLVDAPPPLSHVPISRAIVDAHIGIKFRRDAKRGAPSELTKLIGPLTVRNNLRAAEMLAAYRPERTDFSPKMVLLRSKEGFRIEGHENKWLGDRSDVKTAVADWEEVVGRDVKVVDISGNHFEAFEPQHIEETARAIKEACDELGDAEIAM